MRKLAYIILIILSFFVILGAYYLTNSLSLDKVLEQDKRILKVLDIVPIGTERIVIFDSGQYVQANSYRKSLLGWKATGTTSPLPRDYSGDLSRSVERIGTISVDQNQVYFGVINPDLVKEVRIYNDIYDLRFLVQSYYWYIPIWSNEHNNTENKISFILHDGSEIEFPFNN